MIEAEANIRESLLQTLSFLASMEQQREFAARVQYDCYQDEFACWWFDTFYLDEPSALRMFSAVQLSELRTFSDAFDNCTRPLDGRNLSLAQLQESPEWKAVAAHAQSTLLALQNAT